jgi:hypothetical protein
MLLFLSLLYTLSKINFVMQYSIVSCLLHKTVRTFGSDAKQI